MFLNSSGKVLVFHLEVVVVEDLGLFDDLHLSRFEEVSLFHGALGLSVERQLFQVLLAFRSALEFSEDFDLRSLLAVFAQRNVNADSGLGVDFEGLDSVSLRSVLHLSESAQADFEVLVVHLAEVHEESGLLVNRAGGVGDGSDVLDGLASLHFQSHVDDVGFGFLDSGGGSFDEFLQPFLAANLVGGRLGEVGPSGVLSLTLSAVVGYAGGSEDDGFAVGNLRIEDNVEDAVFDGSGLGSVGEEGRDVVALEEIVQGLEVEESPFGKSLDEEGESGLFTDLLAELGRLADGDSVGVGDFGDGLEFEDVVPGNVRPLAVVEEVVLLVFVEGDKLDLDALVRDAQFDSGLDRYKDLNVLIDSSNVVLVVERGDEGDLGLDAGGVDGLDFGFDSVVLGNDEDVAGLLGLLLGLDDDLSDEGDEGRGGQGVDKRETGGGGHGDGDGVFVVDLLEVEVPRVLAAVEKTHELVKGVFNGVVVEGAQPGGSEPFEDNIGFELLVVGLLEGFGGFALFDLVAEFDHVVEEVSQNVDAGDHCGELKIRKFITMLGPR
ncbi:UNVERIFIED_CONTAM: hypothetical protein PYX00_009917 [Menopon gallinae]|uniref:NAD-specific glutamate dehydrogenase n=1 Tax=Menopon gallinae TaxID=328185 RepID=A0AAW2HCV4_9NEOP